MSAQDKNEVFTLNSPPSVFHDSVLEAEAKRQRAAYFVKPWKPAEFLTTVSRMRAAPLPPPRSSKAHQASDLDGGDPARL